MNNTYPPGICYWSMQNPCSKCRTKRLKGKCRNCEKSVIYVEKIFNEFEIYFKTKNGIDKKS